VHACYRSGIGSRGVINELYNQLRSRNRYSDMEDLAWSPSTTSSYYYVEDMMQRFAQVSLDFDFEEKENANIVECCYELPDGQIIDVHRTEQIRLYVMLCCVVWCCVVLCCVVLVCVVCFNSFK